MVVVGPLVGDKIGTEEEVGGNGGDTIRGIRGVKILRGKRPEWGRTVKRVGPSRPAKSPPLGVLPSEAVLKFHPASPNGGPTRLFWRVKQTDPAVFSSFDTPRMGTQRRGIFPVGTGMAAKSPRASGGDRAGNSQPRIPDI
ncbi:hypothetical protein PIB30_044379 [Stylosanthes scabra]|uniref:Uncharacterized protein n=1 Tax=Stylosanthes scabra TaxID=79078 RepID=A0ABU6VDR4_9FABA|nr:hypothetical protein [Stylosanthes scabra]